MRYDYFLIWGNGLHFRDQIIEEIRKDTNFRILKILHYKPKSLKKFVRIVYSYDYAPFWHLRDKTEYLMRTTPEVEFIFTKNLHPCEDYFGEEAFRHIESRTVRNLKETIRNRYNQKKDDRRTEDHVIHASDNQDQTDYILRYLGFREGLRYLTDEPNKLIQTKYYLEPFHQFTLKKVDIDSIFCNILTGSRDAYTLKVVPIEKTPHFSCLCGKPGVYKKYIEDFSGGPLTEDYTVEHFKRLSKDFTYLGNNHSDDYIIAERLDPERYCILDGLHRAAILKHRGKKRIIIAITGNENECTSQN